MPLKDLRSFVDDLEAAGELVRIRREVDPRFEVAAIIHRLQREHNKAVVFERVRGSGIPIVGNVLGSYERIARLLGVTKDAIARTWGQMEDDLASWPDGRGELTDEPYEEISLDRLPLLTHCEKDGGLTSLPALRSRPIPLPASTISRIIASRSPIRAGWASASRRGITWASITRPPKRGAVAAGGCADRCTPRGDAGGGSPSAPPRR